MSQEIQAIPYKLETGLVPKYITRYEMAMTYNHLRLPGFYWVYRKYMIYDQTEDSHEEEIPNS